MRKILIILACFQMIFFHVIHINGQGIEIQSGGDITMVGSATIEIINGDLVNNGVYVMDNEVLTFSGTSHGMISGDGNNDIYSLKVNNSNGVLINSTGYTAINNSLEFSNGLVNTGSNVIVIKDGAIVTGSDATKYINGTCQKVGNDAFIFPVGNNGKYAPIGISAPGNLTDIFTATYFYQNPNPLYNINSLDIGLDHVSGQEYWELLRSAGSSNAKVTLYWDSSSGVDNLSDLVVARWNNTLWTDEGSTNTTGNQSAGTITSGIVNDFSQFTFGSSTLNNPLPVALISFTATCETNKVNIQWTTASETNCDYFIVEKMQEGGNFYEIAKVQGHGTYNSVLNYQMYDLDMPNKETYYRISQADYSGNINIMDNQIVTLNCNNSHSSTEITITENLDIVRLYVNAPKEEPVKYTVFDINGGQIAKSAKVLNAGENLIKATDYRLDSGIYLVCFELADCNQVAKMVVR